MQCILFRHNATPNIIVFSFAFYAEAIHLACQNICLVHELPSRLMRAF